ncbi:MAG: hypothetical protein QXF46_08905 [Thermofilaceae archaeon]
MSYIVRWGSKPWLETKYVGIKVEHEYNYSLVLLDERMFKIAEAWLAKSGDVARGPLWLKLDTVNKLPMARRMVESLDKARNELEKYITSLRLAYIGTKTFTSFLRGD